MTFLQQERKVPCKDRKLADRSHRPLSRLQGDPIQNETRVVAPPSVEIKLVTHAKEAARAQIASRELQ